MHIRSASSADLGELLTLQRAAFVDEARLYETPNVPALEETIDEMASRLRDSATWVAVVEPNRIVGAVSLRDYRAGGPDIERLMVAPDKRGVGVARELLAVAEAHARGDGHAQIQLIVGDLAISNRSLYAHLGWVESSAHRLDGFEHVLLHTMTKSLLL